MAMARKLTLFAALAGMAVAVSAAPVALKGVSGGLWELEGIPGKNGAVQQCFADPLKIATVEHGSAKCNVTLLGESGSTIRLSYQCAGGGFGQASIKTITPRSLRVEVQGINDGAPYGYVLQAHNTGPCPGAGGGTQERGLR